MDSIEDKSNSSKNNVKILFSAINRYCLERDFILKDYSKFVKIKRKTVFPTQNIYTKKEIEIVEQSQEPIQMILLYTGMRISELLNLKTKDITKHGDRFLINRQWKYLYIEEVFSLFNIFLHLNSAREKS